MPNPGFPAPGAIGVANGAANCGEEEPIPASSASGDRGAGVAAANIPGEANEDEPAFPTPPLPALPGAGEPNKEPELEPPKRPLLDPNIATQSKEVNLQPNLYSHLVR